MSCVHRARGIPQRPPQLVAPNARSPRRPLHGNRVAHAVQDHPRPVFTPLLIAQFVRVLHRFSQVLELVLHVDVAGHEPHRAVVLNVSRPHGIGTGATRRPASATSWKRLGKQQAERDVYGGLPHVRTPITYVPDGSLAGVNFNRVSLAARFVAGRAPTRGRAWTCELFVHTVLRWESSSTISRLSRVCRPSSLAARPKRSSLPSGPPIPCTTETEPGRAKQQKRTFTTVYSARFCARNERHFPAQVRPAAAGTKQS